jgi:hypothetical protein
MEQTPSQRDPEEVLIIRPGALGDTLMLVPVLSHLKGRARTVVAARRPGLELLGPLVERCLDFEGPGWHHLFEEEPVMRGAFEGIRPERVVAFVRDADGMVARNLARFFPDAEIHVCQGYPDPAERVHAARYLAEACAMSGLPVDPKACLAVAQNRALLASCAPGAPARKSGIILHPGSGSARKNLSVDSWRDLMEGLRRMKSPARAFRVTVVLGPAEEDLFKGFEGRLDQDDPGLVFSPEMPLLCDLLGSAIVYVGHDSGITHLSAMLGTPTIAVFRASDPLVWGPIGPRVWIIDGQEEERGVVQEILRRINGLVPIHKRGF